MSEKDTAAAAAAEGGEGTSAAPSVEDRARRMGWVPKDEFRGDETRWVDAAAFVERGDNELPILRERNRKLDGKIAQLETTIRDFAKYHEKTAEREHKRALKEVELRHKEAVSVGDVKAATEAAHEMAEIKADAPKAGDTKKVVEPEVTAWLADNSWFNADKKLNAFATELHGEILRDKPGLSLAENLEEVTKEVRRRFPEKFGNPRRNDPPAVEGAGGGGARKRSKTYADLPPEARAACDRFVKQGLMKREQYVAEYEWEA
jgi:hypothetical protein